MALMIVSYGNFIFFLRKCSMPFFKGNWNLIFPSFISIIAPIVLRKGLPRIIGHRDKATNPTHEHTKSKRRR